MIRRFHHDESYYNATMDENEPQNQIQKNPDSMYKEERLKFQHVFAGDYPVLFENFANHLLTGEPLIAPGEESICSVAMANTALLSSWTAMQQPYPCEKQEYRRWFEKRKEEERRS